MYNTIISHQHIDTLMHIIILCMQPKYYYYFVNAVESIEFII